MFSTELLKRTVRWNTTPSLWSAPGGGKGGLAAYQEDQMDLEKQLLASLLAGSRRVRKQKGHR